ncbi:hypothetical protein [Petrimonas sulfuriphila]|uniref:hypothetical protein n=1 Tax=Petrimonas sulfuriphila TaxID=285070 RepID=UPI003EB7D7CB
MTKTEFLSASLPYGLKLKSPYGFRPNYKETTDRVGVVRLTGNMYADIENNTFREDFIPIVRTLSDLTKECVQADYNDGKPFVPIVELAKIAFKKLKWDIGFENGRCYLLYSGGAMAYEFTFSFETLSFYCFRCRTHEASVVPYQSELFQLMYKFHFDLITEDCEKVYVTDEFNPYK